MRMLQYQVKICGMLMVGNMAQSSDVNDQLSVNLLTISTLYQWQ